ncbi:MAG: hypothetical protein ABJN04_14575 [Hyphomicrobiales bacterium]
MSKISRFFDDPCLRFQREDQHARLSVDLFKGDIEIIVADNLSSSELIFLICEQMKVVDRLPSQTHYYPEVLKELFDYSEDIMTNLVNLGPALFPRLSDK